MDKCKISIVMPVYNSKEYLKEAIESILNQTYRDFQFIIIDDGSTDGSLDLINEYKEMDDRIVVISRENKGLVFSLNEGISLAIGKYIARMDSDDISIHDRIEKQFNFLEANRDIDILGTNLYVFGNVTEKQKAAYYEELAAKFNDNNIEEIFLTSCAISHPSVMFKKEVFTKLGGYNEEYDTAEDYDLWLRAIKGGYKISRLDERLVRYRIHNKSKTAREWSSYKTLKFSMKAKLNYIKDFKNDDKVNYIIWGAGTAGKFAKEVVDKETDNFNFMGFVDKFKTGDLCGYKIYKPEEIAKIKADYIFIATAPGKKEANDFLINIGLKKVEDYIDFVV
ncbi:glycosyltransferase [Clostridium felsineum]|uniref:glycosyltransferase n=1 Tax=Clostridium felsineum TaxID=36839 RepID=UPI00098C9566|nr:glycosyltransferase [Clostridium felsineum]URZ16003.1 Undecaprenyl-phosphate 4-deoxy-4-formamido-L-arabinose transferase [Clostridium felsineum DSM 794]